MGARNQRYKKQCPRRPCKNQQEQKNRGERRGNTYGFLCKCQPPACPTTPGGNNRQERKDAVSGREDGNREASNTLARQQDRTERRSSAFGGKSQCIVNSVKAATAVVWQISPLCQQQMRGVTRTRWHGQHATVVATKKVHPGGKNGKGRDCDAEQLVKTWRQWCHTST